MPISLIPQVFFDLIARVIPGSVIIIAWYLTILGPNRALNTIIATSSKQGIFNLWSFAILMILSYVLGFVLNELWSLTFRKIRDKGREERKDEDRKSSLAANEKMRKCFGDHKLGLQSQDLPPVYLVHDHLRLHSESEAYRLLKLRAEARLSEALFVGLFLLPVVNILFWYRDASLLMLDRAALELVLIIALVTFWRKSLRFQRFYNRGIYASWLFFSFPIGPLKRKERDEDSKRSTLA